MSIQDHIRFFSQKKLEDKIIALSNEINLLKSSKKKNSITAKSKPDIATLVLIAYYSGMLENYENTNTQKAKEIQEKFETEGHENIRKKLSNIEALKNVKRLKLICKYFENIDDKKSLIKVSNDLKKIEK